MRVPLAVASAAAQVFWLLLAPLPVFAADPPASPPSTSGPSSEPEPYVVAPFVNESSIKNLDWMTSALAVTLAEKLEAAPRLRPAYGPAILDGWSEPFDAQRAFERAREAGARLVFAGSYARPSWRSQVTVRVLAVEASGLRELASETLVGERDELLSLLDGAMDKVLARRDLAVGADAAALHRVPTKDLYAFTLYGRALDLYFGLGVPKNDEEAQKLLTRTTYIDPRFAEAHRALGLVDLARGEDARAAGQYAYALDLKPGYYPVVAGLAQLYRLQGKRQPAREMAEKALALRPWDVDLRLLLGTIEVEAGDLDKALTEVEKVCAARPRSPPARRMLAQIRATRGEMVELSEELARVVELAPEDLEPRLEAGATYMRLGQNERAVAVYEDILRRQPRHVQALKLTGDLYRRLGDSRRAVEAYERLRRMAPEDPRAFFLLGAAYAEAGNDAKALAVLEEAQQFKAYQGEAWTDLGAIHLRRGDLAKAGNFLSRAVARSPLRPKTRFNYALLLDATQQRDKALVEAKAASALDPEDADVPYLAGVILLRLGRLDEAKAEFAAAVRLRPSHADARHNLAMLEDLERRYGSEQAGVGVH